MPEKPYLVPAEAADLLGLSLRTVMRHLASGTIPGKKLGGRWRIRRVDLDAALAAPPPRRRATRGKG